jgi:hypothetical protein
MAVSINYIVDEPLPLDEGLRELFRNSAHLDASIDCCGMNVMVNVRAGKLCASARGRDGRLYGVHGVQLSRGAETVMNAFAELLSAALHGGPRVQRLN